MAQVEVGFQDLDEGGSGSVDAGGVAESGHDRAPGFPPGIQLLVESGIHAVAE